MEAKLDKQRFSLVKGGQQFLVACTAGSEEAAIAQLMDWAQNPDIEFDWFDAAVLSRQINQKLFSRALGTETDTDPSEP